MDHEDTITLDAFLTALSRLGSPLPTALQEELNAIAQHFPDSIYALHEFVDQHAPLKQQYITARQAMPSEGERLKFSVPEEMVLAAEDAIAPSTVSWDEVERQVGSYFKEMALDAIERSHPDYDTKVTEALTAALTEMKQTPAMTTTQFDDWLTSVFDSTSD
ncbi:MAG: hypothetical protein AB4042_19400 [Leptolyngbyaceae cyanobacterium]